MNQSGGGNIRKQYIYISLYFRMFKKRGVDFGEGRRVRLADSSKRKQFNRCKLFKKIINHSYSLEIALMHVTNGFIQENH